MNNTYTHRKATLGLAYGMLAHLCWGFFPVYFKQLGPVPALQVVAHRIVWSALFLCLLITMRHGWTIIRTTIAHRHSMLYLTASALMIALNWLLFIFAVSSGQVLQLSLGYFISPLVSVLLGILLLREHLRRLQVLSLLFAICGVLILTDQHGGVPWIALVLAGTFGCYGLLRKVVAADALTGLAVETFLLAPIAAGYLVYAAVSGAEIHHGQGFYVSGLLMFSGVVTAVPLLLFAAAARNLKLTTIGFLQYISPSLHFLLAVLVYHEPLSMVQLCAFAVIWCGLGCYSADAWLTMKNYRRCTDEGTSRSTEA